MSRSSAGRQNDCMVFRRVKALPALGDIDGEPFTVPSPPTAAAEPTDSGGEVDIDYTLQFNDSIARLRLHVTVGTRAPSVDTCGFCDTGEQIWCNLLAREEVGRLVEAAAVKAAADGAAAAEISPTSRFPRDRSRQLVDQLRAQLPSHAHVPRKIADALTARIDLTDTYFVEVAGDS